MKAPTALFWVFHSPVFGLQELDVETGGRVEAAWVHKALRPAFNWNLPRLSLDWVDERLKENPWVKSTDLHKDLPGRLVVRVMEKREVALLRDAREYSYVDAEGRVITSFDPAEAGSVDLPLLTRSAPGLDLRSALELAREIEEVAPHWSRSLSEIELLGEEAATEDGVELPPPQQGAQGCRCGGNRRRQQHQRHEPPAPAFFKHVEKRLEPGVRKRPWSP